ncbi:MAG: DinB family protein [Bryobacteraceae bacterium]
MTPENASATLEFLCGTLEQEIKTTRCVLAAVPDDKGDYTPHPTSMTALALAVHIATSDAWFLEGIVKGAFEMPDEKAAASLKTASDVVAFYDATMPGLLAQLKTISGEKISTPVPFFDWNMPALNYVNIMLMHSAHHRGQLSTYLRPMGAKVPAIYGGSADTASAAQA